MKVFNRAVSHALPLLPKRVIGFFARPYIAGERLDDAVGTVRNLMKEGVAATIDVLGEEVKTEEQALHAAEIYKQVLQRISAEKLDSTISLKPTHMGLKFDRELCYKNIHAIVKLARIYNNFVRIDMEDHTTTGDTLALYSRLREEFDNVGTVIQAYLRRTVSDVNKLLPIRPNLRVCKGIYIEPYQIAYKNPVIVTRNFGYILEKLLTRNAYVAIATHDETVIWEALRIIDKFEVPTSHYEFQMLLGVTPHLRQLIVKAGHRMRVYVPFGAEWAHYSTRRLKENPNILGHFSRDFIMRRLLRRKPGR